MTQAKAELSREEFRWTLRHVMRVAPNVYAAMQSIAESGVLALGDTTTIPLLFLTLTGEAPKVLVVFVVPLPPVFR
jgi:hypothetical protein